jgi:hypothetical protein
MRHSVFAFMALGLVAGCALPPHKGESVRVDTETITALSNKIKMCRQLGNPEFNPLATVAVKVKFDCASAGIASIMIGTGDNLQIIVDDPHAMARAFNMPIPHSNMIGQRPSDYTLAYKHGSQG